MAEFKQYNRLKIAGHVAFWLASISLILFIFYYNENRIHLDFIILSKALVLNIGFALSVYLNLWVLIPKFLKQKNYVFYVFWLVILLTFSSLFIQFLLIFPLRNILEVSSRFGTFDTNLHAAYFSANLLYVALTSFLKFVNDWIALQDMNLKLAKIERQKLEAELNTLKGQLNPHFLFNSLNNIYSLSLVDSKKVPELILRLADLMRHIIYESRENYILLEKEIDFVNNFIALQKIRTSENVQISYHIRGIVPSAKIAPLLFEPFIDNAFKHGLPGNSKKDFIHITFNFEDQEYLEFSIENNFEEKHSEDAQKKSNGIGIPNVIQRLNLLYSDSDYQLETQHQNSIYTVNLRLKLK